MPLGLVLVLGGAITFVGGAVGVGTRSLCKRVRRHAPDNEPLPPHTPLSAFAEPRSAAKEQEDVTCWSCAPSRRRRHSHQTYIRTSAEPSGVCEEELVQAPLHPINFWHSVPPATTQFGEA